MKTKQSIENYLETILILTERNGQVRSIDIANELSFSKPSISIAAKKLRTMGYIEVDEHGAITLTEAGKNIAKGTYERHTIVSAFLIDIGVNEITAKEDACLIEHILSEESFQKIKEHWHNLL
jgi:Mn-dependent DtxR family transcriptional regulator